MERRNWQKNFRQNDGRRLLWTIFLKHLKEHCTNARKCGSVRPRTSQTAANTSDVNDLSQTGRRSPDVSNIVTDCQKNRYPLFVSCPYNSRRLTSSGCEKNEKKTTRIGAVWNRSKLYQILFQQNSQLHMWTSETHCVFCVPKIMDIDQYLLKSFENITGVRFFWISVDWSVTSLPMLLPWRDRRSQSLDHEQDTMWRVFMPAAVGEG